MNNNSNIKELLLGDTFIVVINYIGGGISILNNGGYNLSFLMCEDLCKKIYSLRLKTILTYVGNNKFKEHYSNRIIRLSDSDYQKIGEQLKFPLYVSLDDLIEINQNDTTFQNMVILNNLGYEELIKDYFKSFEKYCISGIKEELEKEKMDYIK